MKKFLLVSIVLSFCLTITGANAITAPPSYVKTELKICTVDQVNVYDFVADQTTVSFDNSVVSIKDFCLTKGNVVSDVVHLGYVYFTVDYESVQEINYNRDITQDIIFTDTPFYKNKCFHDDYPIPIG